MPIPDWVFPQTSEDPNVDLKTFDRQVPFSAIPDGNLINQLVHGWMNMPTAVTHPQNVVTWGQPNTSYNLRGVYRSKNNPNKVGLEAARLASLLHVQQDPFPYAEAAGTLANELTHFHQNRDLANLYNHFQNENQYNGILGRNIPPWVSRTQSSTGTMLPLVGPKKPDWLEINRRRKAGVYDDSPWILNDDNEATEIRSVDELESTMMDYAMQNYMSALQEQRYQQQRAPALRPH